MVGADYVVHAKPDGMTILFASPAEIVIAPTVYKAMNYDPAKELAPVTLAGTTPVVIVANPSVSVRTLAEVIAFAKRNGQSRLRHRRRQLADLAGVWLAHLADIRLFHVPYGVPARQPAMSWLTHSACHRRHGAGAPFIRNGKHMAIAVTSRERVTRAKDVPTVAETPGMMGPRLRTDGVLVRRDAGGNRRAPVIRVNRRAPAARCPRPPCRAGCRSRRRRHG
jgi:tripartite-type tricarboxylate transporter receptor subunit TctC